MADANFVTYYKEFEGNTLDAVWVAAGIPGTPRVGTPRGMWMADSEATLPTEAEGAIVGVLGFALSEGTFHKFVTGTPNAWEAIASSAHVADASAAHAASAVSVSSSTLVGVGTDVQAVFEEIDDAVATLVAARPTIVARTTALTIDSDSSGGGNGVGATPATSGLSFTPAASTKYYIEADVVVTATTNAGVEFTFTGPASATFVGTVTYFTSDNVIEVDNIATIGGASNYIEAALSADLVQIRGYLAGFTTVAADFVILTAQDTAHADNTVIDAGSVLRATPLV